MGNEGLKNQTFKTNATINLKLQHPPPPPMHPMSICLLSVPVGWGIQTLPGWGG